MDVNSLDCGPFFKSETISPDVTTTSGAGDGSEVTPTNDIDSEQYDSGFVVINTLSSITTAETFGFGLQVESSAADGGTKSGVADVVIQAVTTVMTGPLTAVEDSFMIHVPSDVLHAGQRWKNFLITPSGSKSGTDTCKWNASFVGILKKF